MTAPTPNSDLGRVDDHDESDTQDSQSTHYITTKMSGLSVSESTSASKQAELASASASASASTSTSKQAANSQSLMLKPTTQHAGKASTSETTSGQERTVPPVISAIEKEIVAAFF
ncbi:hypothetical protein SMACR_07967 [Sordaria macrospora]|uniref:WGS project CABT00000000 data, contig 2.48 n=2 Tax=Sordaria macrospora TaxID=5147 RepID=F7W916_SORMK|nr:uncharacterized protein SMAC_07967 [Sordaria macrospora k-hell]KAA8631952.1 hypothetical protein SMACR_07967 [Sordaria macrospora]KAH7632351.1 hypothetical protein B0T09DRAFT_256790 [Sordaria sp. MPI-SDFR-AT-0083]WPJ61147.1 hypothetical protein SMAC4_07967 [Sordaria macrospora]CCC13897.1 unnamed protein product [Sordaria macrospora k-hell]